MAGFNMEEYRQPWETGPHWELKREFMEKYKDDYPVDRLLCLAQAYFNIELLHCSYPEPVMQEVRRLSYQLQGCKRFRETAQKLEKLKKEQPELQAKRGKRNFSDDCSSKPFKFIKFCSPEKTEQSKEVNELADSEAVKELLSNSTSLDAGDKCASLHINKETFIFSLLQSPDFGYIKKLSEALPKKYPSVCEGIQSAVERCGLEDVVKYTFVSQNASESWSQFYVGNTLLSTGRSGNDRSARTQAAEYALDVLKSLCNFPHKTLNDLKQEWWNWMKNEETITSGIMNSNSPIESKIFASLTHMEKDPNYKDLCLVMKIIKELKSVSEKQLTTNESKKRVCPAQLLQQTASKKECGCSNVFFFNFYEDPYTPMHLRLYYCDLVINKVFICQGKGSNKKLARTDAAKLGILFLMKFFDLDETLENLEEIREKKKPLQSQLRLEKHAKRHQTMNVASSSSIEEHFEAVKELLSNSTSLDAGDKCASLRINKETFILSDSEAAKESFSNSTSLDAGDKCASLHINKETFIFSLLQSPDFGYIKKLSEALPTKYPSACEGMQSAVERCGLEDVVKYTFVSQNASESWSQFYVGNTLLSTGRSGNDRSARKRAAEYALDVLKSLCNFPHKTLNDLKQEWRNWMKNEKTIPSGIMNSNSPIESKIFASLTHMEKDPNYKDLCLAMKIIKELKSVSEKQLTTNEPKKRVCPAQLLQQTASKKECGCSDVFFFNFYEDPYTPMHLRLYYCDLVINKIFICQGKGSNKKLARTDAAELGILFLTKFFDLDETLENLEQIHEKEKSLQSQLRLEKRAKRRQTMNVASSSSIKDDSLPNSSEDKSIPHKKDQSNSDLPMEHEIICRQTSNDNFWSPKVSEGTAPSFTTKSNAWYDTGFRTEPRMFTVQSNSDLPMECEIICRQTSNDNFWSSKVSECTAPSFSTKSNAWYDTGFRTEPRMFTVQSNSDLPMEREITCRQTSNDNFWSPKVSECTAPSFSTKSNAWYDTGFRTEPRMFTVNPILLSNSYQRQLVLYDLTECGSQQTPSSILHCSVNKCKRKMVCEMDEFNHDPKESIIFRFNIAVDGEHFGSGCAFTKQEAKFIAQQNALRKLQETVYTIKVRNEIDESFIVSRNQILNATNTASVLTDSNIGCKMLKTMGWTGGAIGKSGGITEPITASEYRHHQGLGFSSNICKETDFKRKIDALLRDYSKSNTTSDLIFSTDFTKEERKLIHGVVVKYRLISNSRGKDGKRQLFISRKITPMDLLNLLVNVGGSTEKYELQDRSTWQV